MIDSGAEIGENTSMDVDEAIESRRSVRGFTQEPVARSTIEHILRVARRAPSGTNMQPWRVYVVTGTAKEAITREVMAMHEGPPELREPEYKYYPDVFYEPYKSRRRKIGWDMYSLVGIERGEHKKMHAQAGENFRFFGAPVGLFFFVDKALELGSWIDCGMFIQNVMLAARGQGLHTCSQAAWPPFHKAVRKLLGVDEDKVLICGMAIGHEDTAAPINRLRTEREEVTAFTTFLGFEPESGA